ncbi:ankyrin repeat domain-containing protein, partial [bacterium]|nr:ankyrin repeat domain-containing protein [bacterium]
AAVKQCIAAGADINAKIGGWTALHHAANVGNKEIVELLIANGADVNAKDDNLTLWTPLHKAASRGHNAIVEILLSRSANVNAKDGSGRSPLDWAVLNDHTETADLLRKHGGRTGEELEAAEPVAEASQPEPTTAKAPDISIHDAAYEGNVEAVKQHLDAGTDVNPKESRWTPLHRAALKGHKEIAELLIAKGADVNAWDGNGKTSLHLAATKEIVELLIDKGANVNAQRDNGDTPLDWANDELADLLRKHGGKYGSIHTAAAGGDTEAVKEFLAAGTDVNANDKWGLYKGETSLDWAIQQGKTETADLLRKHGGKTGEELKAEGKRNKDKSIQMPLFMTQKQLHKGSSIAKVLSRIGSVPTRTQQPS